MNLQAPEDELTVSAAPLESALAGWLASRKRSVLREMVAVVSRPGVLSLAGGLPAAEHFPRERLAEAVGRVLRDDAGALQYSPATEALKLHVCRLMERRGVECTTDQILITSGAQQGIDVATRMLLETGGTVALEEITYTGVRQAIAPFSPCVLPLATDLERGLDPNTLEHHLVAGRRPAFVYVIPDAHNPLGVSIERRRRHELVELARRFAVPVIEDDPYGLLAYDGEAEPPLRAAAADLVIYLGSFSKIIAPGLRLGWMLMPQPLVERASVVKEACDLETSSLVQRTVAELLRDFDLDQHLIRLRGAYRAKRNALLDALQRRLPAECRWTRPCAGMFVWVELPGHVDSAELLRRTIDRDRVAFIPGHAFAASGSDEGRSSIRLSFSTLQPEQYDRAVAAIAAALEETPR